MATAEQPDPTLGISRRTVLRPGAMMGGALLWATPVVQSIAELSERGERSGAVVVLVDPTGQVVPGSEQRL